VTRVILDTNVYVGWLRRRAHADLLLGRDVVRYLSAVVIMELRAGVVSRRGERALDQLLRPYAEAGRILSPSASNFDRAGRMLRQLRARGREVRRASVLGDVLIALTARASGATVWTADAGDFGAIRAIEPFSLRLATS
jgi:predicted nucleic acid-binding protein